MIKEIKEIRALSFWIGIFMNKRHCHLLLRALMSMTTS